MQAIPVGFLLLAFTLAIPAVASAEEDPHAKHRAMMRESADKKPEAADVDLRDRTLLTQDGQEVRFVSDVIGDKIVVMDFVYTTCTTVCPVLSALFTQVQGKLGDRLDDRPKEREIQPPERHHTVGVGGGPPPGALR